MQQANSLMMFQQVANSAVTVEQHQDGNTMIAMFRDGTGESLLVLSLKEVTKGYYSLAYHCITNDDETSLDYSLPFPAYCAPKFIGEIVNDVFPGVKTECLTA